MNTIIEPEDVVAVIKSFMACNNGDEASEALILAMGAELLDVPEDKLLEMIGG